MGYLDQLNESQREAVVTTEGPVMVMAGAGSGKTKVLTSRIAYLIDHVGVYQNSILAVTFTNKAAREMKERISKLVDCDTRFMWVSTFHSFCARFLRIEMDALTPFTKRFNIIDEEDAIKILREIIKSKNLDIKEYPPKKIKSYISKKKNGQSLSFLLDHVVNKVNMIEKAYSEKLKNDNLVDFDDLILHTITILKENPEILNKYQEKFGYIMIDEFQDTNTVQYELMKMLGKKSKNIFVVGDQDQSIYAFRGAKVENINLFTKDFTNTKVILLEKNYRSTESILNAANNVIGNNKSRFKKTLTSVKGEGTKPFYQQFESGYAENAFVAEKINYLHSQGRDFKDFAIMYRSNYLSRNIEDILIRNNIPYMIYGGISFYGRKEIKDMVAYLEIIIEPTNDFYFKRVVNEPKRKIGKALMTKLTTAQEEHGCSLFDAIDYVEASGQGFNNLITFKFTILELQDKIEDGKLKDTIDRIIETTGYGEMLKSEGSDGSDRLDNIREFQSSLNEEDEYYEGLSNKDKLDKYLSDLALRTDTDNKKDDDECVKLMTFHQAKGLEFPVVFIVALEEGIFPSRNSVLDKEIEEERRVCYVGITRAKEKLYLSNSEVRNLFGYNQRLFLSRFVKEIGMDNLSVKTSTYARRPQTTTTNGVKTIRRSAKKTESTPVYSESNSSSYNVGDKINHKKFGDGLIVSVDGKFIKVAFKAPNGVKKLMASHPSIRRLAK